MRLAMESESNLRKKRIISPLPCSPGYTLKLGERARWVSYTIALLSFALLCQGCGAEIVQVKHACDTSRGSACVFLALFFWSLLDLSLSTSFFSVYRQLWWVHSQATSTEKHGGFSSSTGIPASRRESDWLSLG